MRYYISHDEDQKNIYFFEYPYEVQTMTEVTEQEYFKQRKLLGFDDSSHWENRYQELVVSFIREKYSTNDENKVVREYLSDLTNDLYRQAFNRYNEYVVECKEKGKNEINKLMEE